jgi:hypothetical protein
LSQDNVLSIATGYRPDGRDSILGRGKRFVFLLYVLPTLLHSEYWWQLPRGLSGSGVNMITNLNSLILFHGVVLN